MSFSPVVPFGGYGGWSFLQRTLATQKAAFENSARLQRDEDYFREKIGSITSAEQLVSDRRLLGVALGAFGLDADIDNRFFIRKVLEGGTINETALANRLANKQYQAFSRAFGFGDYSVPGTQISDFGDRIITAYKTRQFEIAVGEQNSDMRLAMNAQRELAELAASSRSENTKWFTVMGSEPLRRVFEFAFGLPASFSAIDLDQQLTTFKDRAEQAFGSSGISQFTDPARVDSLLRRFLARSDAASGPSALTRGAGALTLLQDTSRGSAASIPSILS